MSSWVELALVCDECNEMYQRWCDLSGFQVSNLETGYAKSKRMIELADEWSKHNSKAHPPPKPKKEYAFTFTTNLNTELEIQKEMCDSAMKLFSQSTVPVEAGEVFLEYTEAGRPHLHGWYRTQDGGRIFAKVFRRCWPYWMEKDRQKRFGGGYHEEMKSNRYRGYASSEGRLIISKEKGCELVYNEDQANKWFV